MGNTSITRLTDRELLTRVEELSRKERRLTLAVIDHLIEVERRRLHAERGHRSVFAYCIDELGYSGSAAHRRISAARAIRRFPKIRRSLEERRLTLSALAVVDEGHGAPGEHFRRGSKTTQPVVEQQNTKPRFAVERKYTFEFAGSEAFMKKYQRAVALLSNKLGGQVTIGGVFEALLDDYIERHDPERRRARRQQARISRQACSRTGECGTTVVEPAGAKTSAETNKNASTASHQKPPSRHIPAATRDAVFVRDRGRCTFVSENGTRCRATRNLQIDHITPYAMGGTHDAGNLRLLCAAHNRLMAERAFGRAHLSQFSRRE